MIFTGFCDLLAIGALGLHIEDLASFLLKLLIFILEFIDPVFLKIMMGQSLKDCFLQLRVCSQLRHHASQPLIALATLLKSFQLVVRGHDGCVH